MKSYIGLLTGMIIGGIQHYYCSRAAGPSDYIKHIQKKFRG